MDLQKIGKELKGGGGKKFHLWGFRIKTDRAEMKNVVRGKGEKELKSWAIHLVASRREGGLRKGGRGNLPSVPPWIRGEKRDCEKKEGYSQWEGEIAAKGLTKRDQGGEQAKMIFPEVFHLKSKERKGSQTTGKGSNGQIMHSSGDEKGVIAFKRGD